MSVVVPQPGAMLVDYVIAAGVSLEPPAPPPAGTAVTDVVLGPRLVARLPKSNRKGSPPPEAALLFMMPHEVRLTKTCAIRGRVGQRALTLLPRSPGRPRTSSSTPSPSQTRMAGDCAFFPRR